LWLFLGCDHDSVPSIGFGMDERSHIRADESSPAVAMWQDECGALGIKEEAAAALKHSVVQFIPQVGGAYHANELIHELCPDSSAAGRAGTRMSRIITLLLSIDIVAK